MQTITGECSGNGEGLIFVALDSIKAQLASEKQVPIYIMFDDGEAFPADTKIVWQLYARAQVIPSGCPELKIRQNANRMKQKSTLLFWEGSQMKKKLKALLCLASAAAMIAGAGTAWAASTVSQTLSFSAGWTLSGNALKSAFAIETLFGSKAIPITGVSDRVVSVWQWDGAAEKWKFYTPSMTPTELAAYATSKGYGTLSEIGAGAGFWVNSSSAVTLAAAQTGSPASLTVDDLPAKWSLNAAYTPITPGALNTSSTFLPPSPGESVVNFVTLWAWDNTTKLWLFYAPILANDGTQAAYIADKGYLSFSTLNTKLQAGIGFWINKTGALRSTPPEIFPTGMAIAAPTAAAAPTAGTTGGTTNAPPAVQSKLKQAAETVRSILSGAASFKATFNATNFMRSAGNAPCFGPELKFTGHPNAPLLESSNGTLPGGDLGIWTASITQGTGTVACAAATLEQRMNGVSDRTNMALVSLAGLLVEAKNAGKLPTAGNSLALTTELNALGITGVTFSSATLALDSTGGIWSYSLAFTFVDGGGKSHNATIALTHTAPVTAPRSTYSGVMKWSMSDTNSGSSACSPSDGTAVTTLGSLKYQRTSSTEIANIMRNGTYCGLLSSSAAAAMYSSDGQLKPDSTWSDNFSRFGSQYNPLTLDGFYGYGWQAGKNDQHVRMFVVGINGETKDGEAWYGYGDDISTSDGSIKGFYCNWAGPGNQKGDYSPYAQRQFIKQDSTTGLWAAVTGGSNIRYAPTNACTYSGTGFWYDRDLNQAANEVGDNITVSTSDTENFLYQKGSSATITDAIKARGMTFPPF